MVRKLTKLSFPSDENEYVWDFIKAKSVLSKFSKENDIRQNVIYDELAKKIMISSGAVKNWFTRKNGPGESDYVVKMAEYFVVNYKQLVKKLVNETESEEEWEDMIFDDMYEIGGTGVSNSVKFIGLLNELALATTFGIIGFSEYMEKLRKNPDSRADSPYRGIIYVDNEMGGNYGKIIADMCVDANHSDVVSTFDQLFNMYDDGDYKLTIRDEDPDEIFLELSGGDDLCVVIEGGRWYCC